MKNKELIDKFINLLSIEFDLPRSIFLDESILLSNTKDNYDSLDHLDLQRIFEEEFNISVTKKEYINTPLSEIFNDLIEADVKKEKGEGLLIR